MNNLLLEKLEEMFNKLDNCDGIKNLLALKRKIYNDKALSNLLKKYRELDQYDLEFIELKKKIVSNPLIEEYRKLEDKLYFVVLETNQKLNTLVNKKGC